MTTLADAIKDALDDNWAGSGGTEPILYNTEDVGQGWPPDDDWVMLLGWTYEERTKRRNDGFVRKVYRIDMRVHSKNDANGEERLDTIVTEIYRIITPTNVTGYHLVDIIDQTRRASDKRQNIFIADLTVECIILSTSSAVTPGSGGDGDVVFPADVTVTDDLITDNIISADPISIRPSGNIVDYLEFDTVGGHPVITVVGGGTLQIRGDSGPIRLQPSGDYTDSVEFSTTANVPKIAAIGASDLELGTDTNTVGVDQIAALLMFGAANAAWVPMILMGGNLHSEYFVAIGRVFNVGADDFGVAYALPIPTTKGSLKLHIKNFKYVLFDADASDYLTAVDIDCFNGAAYTEIDADATDHTTPGDKTFSGATMPAAAIDVSSYESVTAYFNVVVTTGLEFELANVRMECYYAA